MAELFEFIASLLISLGHGGQYRDDLRGATPQRLAVIALLLLLTLCAGIACLILSFV